MKKENNINEQAEVFEEEKVSRTKNKEAKAEKPRTFAAFKVRVRKARRKAEATGIFYLLFTILLAGFVILPAFVSTNGTLNVLNFWKPFTNVKSASKNLIPFVMSVIASLFYFFIALSLVVNMFKSFACLEKLYKKKPSRQNGYNRNAQAMEKMGRIYSSSVAAIVVFGLLMNVFAGVTVTPIFWAVIAVALLVHFWLGLRSGNVSFFEVGKNTEIKRVGGRFAPFVRNVFQLIVSGLIAYYFMQVNAITNLLKLLEKGAFAALKSDMTAMLVYVVLPAVQLLMLIWIIAMLRHAINPSEYHHDGKHAPGRLTFRWMSMLLLITSAGAFALTMYISKKAVFPMSLGCVYIAALSLAAFIEEVCMARLPNDRENHIVEYENPAQAQNVNCCGVNVIPCAQGYHVPINCIAEPGVFMQPNGQPIMVMPMLAGARPAPQMVAPTPYSYDYRNPYATYAQPAQSVPPFDPYHAKQALTPSPVVEATAESRSLSQEELYEQALREQNIQALTEKWIAMANNPVPKDDAEELTEDSLQETEVGKKWSIACPDCGARLSVQEGSFAYRCPDCGCAFKLNKSVKTQENNE